MPSLNQIIKQRIKNLPKSIQELSDSKTHQIAALHLSNEFINSYVNHVHDSWSEVPINIDNEDEEFHIVEMAGLLIDDKFILTERDKTQSKRDFHFNKMKAFIRGQMFIAIMGELEDFFSKILLLTLQAYPEKLGEQKLRLKDIECKFNNFNWVKSKEKHINFNTSEDLIKEIDKQIERAIMEMIYKGSDEYIKKLRSYLSKDKNSEGKDKNLENLLWWFAPLYAEMKARRNAALHNGWYRNDKYDEIIKPIKSKLKDIEKKQGIPYPVSEFDFLGIDSDYFDQSYKIARQVIDEFTSLCINNFKITKKS
ncbi:hypothetical protein H6G91_39320 [Nostoc muscorum FACHB-395]|nr:hypothetical protein [Desmonostoc muscorum FACHB-395]